MDTDTGGGRATDLCSCASICGSFSHAKAQRRKKFPSYRTFAATAALLSRASSCFLCAFASLRDDVFVAMFLLSLIVLSFFFCCSELTAAERAPINESPVATSREPTPSEEDANLHDVQFVGSRNGWAVGDRGVIWHTSDGGESWSHSHS